MRKRIAALVLLLAVVVTGKSGLNSVKADPAPGMGEQVDVDGLYASIETDKKEYEAGEEIVFSITFENLKLHSYTAKTTIVYTNTPGLTELEGESLPTDLPRLEYGAKQVVTGKLKGDPSIFPPTVKAEDPKEEKESSPGRLTIFIAVAAVVVAVLAMPLIVLKKRSGKKILRSLALILTGSLLISLVPEQKAYAADYEKIVLRPYIYVTYGGQEVLIRANVEFHSYQERVIIPKEHKTSVKGFTCHDPSIFKDKDGKYYILGTHITGGTSDDLINWTTDTGLRNRFSRETIDKIREWNKDSGDWFGYLWAPDIVYNPVLKKYCYYLSANGDDWKSNIVMLTADAPNGPFEYAGSVVYGGFTDADVAKTDVLKVLGTDRLPERYITKGIANRKWGDKWPNCIDPCVFYDDEGKLWMSYGSWSGGIFILELDENTGLRDYNVSYENNEHSDAYFGKKIAGGWYVSGEGSYIQKIGDWYWLFMSYGNLEAKGGYNIRVFRSETPDGNFIDELGNSALYDKYVFNYNQNVGVRLFGGYKWRNFAQGQVAQGHNSAFVDDDGRAYIVYHSRTTDGSEGHTVKIHQLFLNREGWLVAAPYYFADEKAGEAIDVNSFAGDYEVILHRLDINYKSLDTNKPEFITLNADGTITGAYSGEWSVDGAYISLEFNGDVYSGVAFRQCVEYSDLETDVFTALGKKSQISIWGSKTLDIR